MRHAVTSLSPDAPVRAFAAWWLRERPPFVVPADGVRVHPGIHGLTVFREGPFQAQLFIVAPHGSAPAHAHPNVDSVEYDLSKAGTFTSERNCRIGGFLCVAPGEVHTAKADARGGSFISFQKWLNGVPPSSVENDWRGEVISEAHAQSIIEAAT